MNQKPSLLREAARQRLKRLDDISPEDLEAEIKEARKEGYKPVRAVSAADRQRFLECCGRNSAGSCAVV